MDKKKLIIIQIALWIGVAVFLSAVLGFALREDETVEVGFLGRNSTDYVTEIEGLSTIDINLVSEDVELYSTDSNILTIKQNANYAIKEKDQLRVAENGKTLSIKKSAKRIIGLNFINRREVIQIYIPTAYLGDVEVTTVSGEINVNDIVSNGLECRSTSGEIEGKNLVAKEMHFGTVSGDVECEGEAEQITAKSISGDIALEGSYKRMDTSSTSGGIEIESNIPVEKIEATTVSGDVNLYLTENTGFTIDFRSVSGRLSGDMIEGRLKGNEKYTYKDGAGKIIIKTTSGDGEIELH